MRKILIFAGGPLFLILGVVGIGYKFYSGNFLFGLIVLEIGLIGMLRNHSALVRQELEVPSISQKLALFFGATPVIGNTVMLCAVAYKIF